MSDSPIECGEGWRALYAPLIDLCAFHGIQVDQVKEKFGGLRFYVSGEKAEYLETLISAAEALSFHICEECGESRWERDPDKPGSRSLARLRTSSYWLKTLCDWCEEKRSQTNVRHQEAV